jgi:hypothetical protein
VQMDGMRHHAVVHENDTQRLAVHEFKRRRLGELVTIE